MSYFPAKRAAIIAWIKNAILKLPGEAAKVNEPEADTAVVVADLQNLLNTYDAAEVARANAKAANAVMLETEKTVTKKIRAFVQRLKANQLVTDEIQKILLIYTMPVLKDLTNFIPSIVVRQTGSRVKINFKKKKMHAMNVYAKRGDETNFTLLATATKNPFYDNRPPLKEGFTEMREFYGVAVENNEEVGKPSAPVGIAFRS